MNKIDGSYRLLFSNPHLVRDLFQGIINQPWLDTLDWSKLQPLPSDYISSTLRQRQGDCVWQLPRNDGESLFIVLMLEHQSKTDRNMSLRLITYCALLYESLLGRKLITKGQRLPIILPVVLYSGVKRWTAPLSMSELIDPSPATLHPYLLQMSYLLVDEGQLVRNNALPANNLASLLFRLEHNQGMVETQELMQTLWNSTTGPEFVELRKAVTTWLKHVLLPRALPNINLSTVDDLLEIKDMINEHSRAWSHQWKAEGVKEGVREGASAVVHRLLQRKFGTLSPSIQKRLDQATAAQLEAWSLNILDATTLDEVFKD